MHANDFLLKLLRITNKTSRKILDGQIPFSFAISQNNNNNNHKRSNDNSH
jgi:hypothetical protein